MKKKLIVLFLTILFVFVAAPAWALILLPNGFTSSLPNSNQDTEERWLEGILGLSYNSPSVNYMVKIEFPESLQSPTLSQFDPESSWTYVIVKYGHNWMAFQREESDSYLSVTVPQDISHVTFFGNGAQVPEPGTILLLGLGLLGLGITTRRKS